MSIACYFSSLCVYAIIGPRKNQNIFSEVMNMNFIKKNWKGVLLCLIIAIPSWILGKIFPIVGGPVFAILLGMVITLLVRDKSALQSGITFVSKKILQYAVILLGFGMNLSVILQTGKQSLPIILATITTSLVVAWVLHKILHVPGKISTLIGVGSSICGGSAIAATAPVIDADDEEVAQSISVIFFPSHSLYLSNILLFMMPESKELSSHELPHK